MLAAGTAPPAQAAADIGIIAIDTDITGNTVTPCTATGDPDLDYPCNNSTILGPIDSCRSIAVGQSIQIDVVGISIPLGGTNGSHGSFQGTAYSDMELDWAPSGPAGPIQVTGKDISVALTHQGLDDSPSLSTSRTTGAGSTSGRWGWTDVDVNTDLVGEGGPGIAIRLTIKGINAGTATLSLGANLLTRPTWTDLHGIEYTVGSYGGAQIVVGAGTCPPTPTPSPIGQTPAPSPTPTAKVAPTATAAPTATVPRTATAAPTATVPRTATAAKLPGSGGPPTGGGPDIWEDVLLALGTTLLGGAGLGFAFARKR